MASEANLGGAVAEIHKISIALTADEIAALRAAVEFGDYATPGEIVREAIRDWQRKRERRQQEISGCANCGIKARPAAKPLR